MLIFLLSLLAVPGTVYAAVLTWTGATGTDWNSGTNWSGTAPLAGDDVLIPGGLTNYPVINGTVTIKSITINNTGSGARITVTTGGSLTAELITVNATGSFIMLGGTAALNSMTCAGAFDVQGGTVTATAGITISGTVIATGTLTLGAADRLADSSPITLGGGIFSTGTTTGNPETAGTLSLTDNSTVALGTGVHSLRFAASNGVAWTPGKTLTITGWTGGYNGTTGTSGKIFAGNTAAGLTPSQLNQIQFYNGTSYYPAAILPTGEIVARGVISSVQSGNWSNPGTWDCGCVPSENDLIIIGAHTVTANQNSSITNISITSGGILTSNGKTLTILRNLQVDGAITGSLKLILSGTNTISGTGVINAGDIDLIAGNKTIAAGTSLDNSAATLSTINIYPGITLRNNGIFITGAMINGVDASSTWVQGAGSGLKVGNEFLLNGTLDASGTGNAIEYFRDGNAPIKTATGAYYNLIISGSDTKVLSANIDINGSLNINSGNFDPAGYSVYIAGNWINNGGFAEGTATVIFDGSAEQTLSVTGGETFYNLQLNNTGAGLISRENIRVTHALIMTAGNINMGADRITLGTGPSNIGSLSHTSGYIIGELERWHTPGPEQYYFPVGSVLYERPVVFINELLSNPGASDGSLII